MTKNNRQFATQRASQTDQSPHPPSILTYHLGEESVPCFSHDSLKVISGLDRLWRGCGSTRSDPATGHTQVGVIDLGKDAPKLCLVVQHGYTFSFSRIRKANGRRKLGQIKLSLFLLSSGCLRGHPGELFCF